MDFDAFSRKEACFILILSRRKGEVIHIGPDIQIHVVDVGLGRVRLGIQSPQKLLILRGELVQHDQDWSSEHRTEVDGNVDQ